MAGYTDACGSRTEAFKKAVRIVSLVPSQTELLHYLGLEEEVVGITKFCVHPAAWHRTKTRIGGTKQANIDKIKSLQPDLILANKEENVKEQVEELAKSFPVWVTDVNTLPDALDMIASVGMLTGMCEKATFLNTHIHSQFYELQLWKAASKKRTCYLIWKDPYLTVGGDTFINALLEQAGFENIFSALKRYPEITIQNLQTMQCECLLLSSEPYPFAEKHKAELEKVLPGTRVILVDGEMFSWYGSRLQWAPAYFKKLHQQISLLKQ